MTTCKVPSTYCPTCDALIVKGYRTTWAQFDSDNGPEAVEALIAWQRTGIAPEHDLTCEECGG